MWTAERDVWEALARGESSRETCARLTGFIEQQAPELIASVLVLDEAGDRWRHGATPDLPAAFVRAVDGLAPGESGGSCVTAAFQPEPELAAEIATSPLWTEYRQLAADHQLPACWSTPVRDAQGTILGALAVYRREPGPLTARHRELLEISARLAAVIITRERAEAARREREVRYEDLYENAPDMMLSIAVPSMLVVQCNRALAAMLGRPKESIVGQSVLEIYTAESANLVRSYLVHEFRATGRIEGVELALQTSDRATRNVLLSATGIRNRRGEIVRSRSVLRDITERKRAEAELRESNERFRQLAENIDQIFYLIELATRRMIYISPTCEAVLGLPPQWHYDHPEGWLSLIHPDDRKRVRVQFDELRMSGSFDGEYRIVRPDGAIRWIRERGFAVHDERGQLYRIAGIATDITDRKQAEYELRLRDQAIATSVMPAAFGDANHVITYANQAFLDLFGFESLEQVRGMPNTRFESQPTSVAEINAAIEQAGSFTGEITSRKLDGTPLELLLSATLIRNEAGQQVGSLVTFVDVTDRKRAEQSVRESERHLQSQIRRIQLILDTTLDGYLLANAQGRLIDVNPSYCRMVGYSREELLQMSVSQLEAALSPNEIAARIGQILAAGRLRFQTRHQHRDGHAVELDVSISVLDAESDDPRVAAFVRDITQQKRAEEALHERIERYELVARGAQDAIWDWDVANHRVYLSPRWAEMRGLSPDQVGDSVEQRTAGIHPDDAPRVIAASQAHLHGETEVLKEEYRIRCADGSWKWVLDRGMALRDAHGKAVRVAGSESDITERKLAEQALRRREEELLLLNASLEQRVAERTFELKQANEDLEAYAHSVAHDLRAPLRAMEGYATAVAEDYGHRLDDEGHEHLRNIITSARRMDLLVKELLAYSRLGRVELRVEEVDLDTTVREALAQVAAEIDASDAAIEVSRPLPSVWAHRSTLVQVVANLVSNAVKFVAQGVRPIVRIWAEPRETARIRLWIADNGIGIDRESHERIFSVFERLHGIESYPGTGIGLAIVARACERLGGRSGVESELGKGSRFWVEFRGIEPSPS